ncbi:hypothetical protein CVT24_007078 [Panaeolus cyanescens]|uniref:Rhodopsin domain-containing protein n=1 Tax=Panaeolus cyanescens TaxID=181874 RepID=A0A409YP42_9AGAR|nr:hypothetical protein CVT24_007078 [Panaeolus cyanescens]
MGDNSFRKLAKCVVVIFVLIGFGLSLQRVFRCGTDFSKPALCTTPRYTGYVELILDLTSDTWLIGAPLYMLRRMRLAREDQRVIGAVFLCGLFTTIASILHDAFILVEELTMVGLTAHIQLAISIVICNLLVLVTYVYRKLHRDHSLYTMTSVDPSSNLGVGETPLTPLGSIPLISTTPAQQRESALISTFHTLALLTTLLRLIHRFRRKRLGWDDFFAGLANVFAIILFVLFLHSEVIFGDRKPPFLSTPVSLRTFGIVGTLVFYMTGLWCSKISIAITIIRLVGDGTFRRIAKAVILVFGLVGISLSLARVFRCGTDFSEAPICPTPRYSGYLELVFDLLGDTWLICAPLYMLRRLKIPRPHQRLIGAVFLCGLFTTLASIVHNSFALTRQVLVAGMTAHIQLGVSIFMCNLLVLATYIYRRVHEDSDETTQRTETPDPDSNGQGRFATPMVTFQPPENGNSVAGQNSRGDSSRPPGNLSAPAGGTSSSHITLTELGSSMLHGFETTFDDSLRNTSQPEERGGPEPVPIPVRKQRRFRLWF